MPMITYVPKKFTAEHAAVIVQANEILDEYAAEGYEMTLRQLYYQFVSRDLLSNDMRAYKRLGGIIDAGRLAGLIDWKAIVDRTRNVNKNVHWDGPGDAIYTTADIYGIDKWADQNYRPEVWIEKEALIGVIEDVCSELDIPWFAVRGYNSQSEMWRAGRRFRKWHRAGQIPIVFHLGDHDPSGIDMTRDNEDRLTLLSGKPVKVKRLALNMNQVEKYDPPPNPAKVTDSRATAYMAIHGGESWELDALEPRVMIGLIKKNVKRIRDDEKWEAKVEEEKEQTKLLETAAERWDQIEETLGEDE